MKASIAQVGLGLSEVIMMSKRQRLSNFAITNIRVAQKAVLVPSKDSLEYKVLLVNGSNETWLTNDGTDPIIYDNDVLAKKALRRQNKDIEISYRSHFDI